jgi:hemerythrin-like domain-containing protein
LNLSEEQQMIEQGTSRREFLYLGTVGIGTALVSSCRGAPATSNQQQSANIANSSDEKKEPDAKEVTAVEDLMREHGILRRALLVYSESALRLRKNASDVSPEALQRTAKLFRAFGEEYHEKKLEEAYLFTRIKEKAAGTEAAKYIDVLVAQHVRGREITDYILSITNGPRLGVEAAKFADVLTGFVRMYEHHAAREDTIIFPAWKDAVTSDEYDELNDKFEDIEHDQFGEDGFEDAAKQMSEIETSLGMSDIAQFTAPSVK